MAGQPATNPEMQQSRVEVYTLGAAIDLAREQPKPWRAALSPKLYRRGARR